MNLQQVADRLAHVEREVVAMRMQLRLLNRRSRIRSGGRPTAFRDSLADKNEQQLEFDRLFEALGIAGTPVGARRLQEMMASARLDNNELSQSIVEAREK
ncbi:MAG: hypothetical protein WHX53_10725 [Anaerolineae bacterium]